MISNLIVIYNSFLILLSIAMIINYFLKPVQKGKLGQKYLENNKIIEKEMKSKTYKKYLFLRKEYDAMVIQMADLYKLEYSLVEKEYKKAFFFSVFISVGMLFALGFTLGWSFGIFTWVIVYFIANWLYLYMMKLDMENYKHKLNNEIIKPILKFKVHYSHYKNAMDTLRMVTKEKTEAGRQIEYLLDLLEVNDSKVAIEIMRKSMQGIPSFELFLIVLQSLFETGGNFEDDITSYVETTISNLRLDSIKRVNEKKHSSEVIIIFFFFIPLAVMILAPVLLSKFDGEHNILDMMNFFGGK